MMTMTTDHDDKPMTAGADGARWGRVPAWWLDHPDIDADAIAVLSVLSTYADAAGVCWPSQATLAEKLKRSRSTVNRIIARLADTGILAVEARRTSNGGRSSSLYRLQFVQECPDPAPDAAVHRHAKPVASADSPCATTRQEQVQSKQIPDSRPARARMDVRSDWMPSADSLAWAQARFPEADLGAHIERFVLKCAAGGYRYADIDAAWRTWLGEDMAVSKPATFGNARTSTSPAARRLETARERSAQAEQVRFQAWASVAAAASAGQRQQTATPIFNPSAWA